jgi:hypothetical protein
MVCSPSLPPDQTIKIGNMKKKLKIALGLSLMPIFALVYFMDRALLIILPHLEQKKINHWFESNEAMTGSFLRIISLATLTGIYKLITFIF